MYYANLIAPRIKKRKHLISPIEDFMQKHHYQHEFKIMHHTPCKRKLNGLGLEPLITSRKEFDRASLCSNQTLSENTSTPYYTNNAPYYSNAQ